MLDHSRHVSFDIAVRNVGQTGSVFVDLSQNVASHKNLSPHNSILLSIGKIAGLGSNVVVVSFLSSDAKGHKVSV